MSVLLESLKKGQGIWLRSKNEGYIAADVFQPLDSSTGVLVVKTARGFADVRVEKGMLKYTFEESELSETFPSSGGVKLRNPRGADTAGQLSNLSLLDDANILHALSQRFRSHQIYTSTGTTVVALNPWESIKGYGPEAMERHARATDLELSSLSPHIYAVAEAARRAAVSEKRSQTILVSGESGAGKTESCKIMMEYLSIAGGASTGQRNSTDADIAIARKVVAVNPLLEAFGNAKTSLNSNSSRFGKHVKLLFDADSGRVAGASVATFLLEKSRVVAQSAQSRNFHIFFQLLRGADVALLEKLGLAHTDELTGELSALEASEFRYLAAGCTPVAALDDRSDFEGTLLSMRGAGLSQQDIEKVMGGVASILHLGNLSFKGVSSADGTAASVVDTDTVSSRVALSYVSKLLAIRENSLCSALTTRVVRSVRADDPPLAKALSVSAAADARDALAKTLYQRLFDHLVTRVNTSLSPSNGKALQAEHVGLLDLFGFEDFGVNSFEQLLINLANERIQQKVFNAHVFRAELNLLQREGVPPTTAVDYADNSTLVDITEKSLIELLDEECKRGDLASDSDFCLRLLSANPDSVTFKPAVANSFILPHYIGPVVYKADEFVFKNRDALHPDLIPCLQESRSAFIAGLFSGGGASQQSASMPPSASSSSQSLSTQLFSSSVARQFIGQLRTLVETISQTHPYFVRCINSNKDKRPRTFDSSYVLSQLISGGVIESVRLMRALYPTRRDHVDFFRKFSEDHVWRALLASRGVSESIFSFDDIEETARGGCLKVCLGLGLERTSEFELGRSLVFFRAGVLARVERMRDEFVGDSASLVRAKFLGWRLRAKFMAMRASARLIQRIFRGYIVRKTLHTSLREKQLKEAREKKEKIAATRIQAHVRGYTLRKRNAVAQKIKMGAGVVEARNRLEVEVAALKAEVARLRGQATLDQEKIASLQAAKDLSDAKILRAGQLFASLERQKRVIELQLSEAEATASALMHQGIQAESDARLRDNFTLDHGFRGPPDGHSAGAGGGGVGGGGGGSAGFLAAGVGSRTHSGITMHVNSALELRAAVAFHGKSRSGFLTKLGEKTKSWKRRWFVLEGVEMHYFKAEKDAIRKGGEEKGVAMLVGCVAEKLNDLADVPHLPKKEVKVPQQVIRLTPGADSEEKRVWYFFADSERDADSWLAAIAINMAISQYVLCALKDRSFIVDTRILRFFTSDTTKVACLDEKPLSVEAIRALAFPLSYAVFSALHTLSLRNARLGRDHALILAPVLGAHRGLRTLILSSNPLGSDAVSRICDAISGRQGGSPVPQGGARSPALISVLALDHCEIDDAAAPAIAALMEAPTLRSLDLSFNKLAGAGAKMLASSLGKRSCGLQYLSLSSNNVDDAGVASLAASLLSNGALTRLDLSKNHIGDDGAVSLAQALSRAELLHISIGSNRFTSTGATALLGAIATSPALLDMDLSNIATSGSDLLKSIAQSQWPVEVSLPSWKISRRPGPL